MGNQNSQSAPPYLALAVISAAGLAYEVLLTRLFSIVQWHHFAYMIISLALLGFGASGTVLAFTAGRWQRRFYPVFAGNALLFSVSSVACFAAAQALPFNPLELFWDPVQPGWLILIYLLLSLPFFFVANCMGLSLFAFPRDIPRIYAWDLVGAGVGALGMVVLLYLIAPGKALLAVAALGMTAAFLTLVPLRCEPGWRLAILAMAAGVWVFPAGWEMPLRLSPFKGLSQALQVTGAGVSQERSSPLGLLSVVENRRIPFRYAPGLSLTARGSPPPQKALFTDADSVTAITRFTGDTLPLEYLDYMPSALPYHLTDRPRVLILGAGGGMGLLQAIYHRAKHIDAVELNPQVADLLRVDYADFAGGIYQRDDVTLHLAEARSYVEQAMGNYGVVQVSLVDSFSASSGGVYALNVSYLYTEEAIRKYLGLLEPDGFLAITRWTKLPPRDGLKLFATVLAALEGSGVSRPEERLAWIRSWNTSTLVISRERLSPAAIVALRRFCAERSFDPIYFPGIVTTEVNRFNRLDDASFHHGAVALLGEERESFIQRYKFDIRSATDDRPYFFDFFKWRTLPEILSLRRQGGVALLDAAYLLLALTLAQALLISLIFILLPVWLRKPQNGSAGARPRRWAVLAYFMAIGIAFLFVEVAFIQKFILFLSHPVYALSVILSGFLVFAGLGSAFTQHFLLPVHRRPNGKTPIVTVTAAIGLIAIFYLVALPAIISAMIAWPVGAKVGIAIMLVAPLAFCMGMPFPLGLAYLVVGERNLIPWAWAINGCASVVSAVLATLVAIQFGFSVVVLTAATVYGFAGWVGSRWLSPSAPLSVKPETGNSKA